jgi:hypothetical protein
VLCAVWGKAPLCVFLSTSDAWLWFTRKWKLMQGFSLRNKYLFFVFHHSPMTHIFWETG